MLVLESKVKAVVRVTAEFQDMLRDHKVFTSPRGSDCRWPIGHTVSFLKSTRIEPYVGIYVGDALCPMGSFSYAVSTLWQEMSIGRYCSISIGLDTSAAAHPYQAPSTSPVFYDPSGAMFREAAQDLGFEQIRTRAHRKPAPRIGNDVWVGQNCAINRGADIGDGAVVGRRALVTKPVPPYTLVGGNPAKFLKHRFPEELCARFLNLQWWRFSPADLRQGPFHDAEAFVSWLENSIGGMQEYKPKPLHVWEEVKRLL